MIKSLLKFSYKYIPKSKFRHFLKPCWTSELTTLHKNMTVLRKLWVDCFKPRDNSPVYKDYKMAKRTFRRCHRSAVNKYFVTLNCEIDDASEVDSATFWKIIKMKNSKGKQPGCEMKFNNESLRDSRSIAHAWGNYFEKLYSPSFNQDYDANFYETV